MKHVYFSPMATAVGIILSQLGDTKSIYDFIVCSEILNFESRNKDLFVTTNIILSY